MDRNKQLVLGSLRSRLVQGERFAQSPFILLPRSYGGIDLSSLRFIMRAVSESGGTMAEEEIPFQTCADGREIAARWSIPESFCAVSGELLLELRGMAQGEQAPIIKFPGDRPILVRPALGEGVAPPQVWERALDEMHAIVASVQQSAQDAAAMGAAAATAAAGARDAQEQAAGSAADAAASATLAGQHASPVADAQVNKEGNLVLTLSSGNELDAGHVRGPAGQSAYEAAAAGGYAGTQEAFSGELAGLPALYRLPNPNLLDNGYFINPVNQDVLCKGWINHLIHCDCGSFVVICSVIARKGEKYQQLSQKCYQEGNAGEPPCLQLHKLEAWGPFIFQNSFSDEPAFCR